MNNIGEGKVLSHHVSYNLSDSAGGQAIQTTTAVHTFQATQYKHTQGSQSNNIERFFQQSRADDPKSDKEPPVANKQKSEETPIKQGFDAPFYLAYAAGFFFSAFAVAGMYSFTKREILQRASIYGATASMLFMTIIGLCFLTSLVNALEKSQNSDLAPARHLALAVGHEALERAIGRLV